MAFMTAITNELMYEILKAIQKELAEVKAAQADHTRQLLRIREDINGLREDINNLRKDDLRIETMQTNMDARLERIERRLNLADA
jgi:septal ring factor EnvC (AmiA/AmiB activator)